jgi:acetyl esterase/lipase
MELSLVSSELRKPLRRVPVQDLSVGWRRALAQWVLGLLPAARTPGVQVEVRQEASAALRLYRPDKPKCDGALLWIHGGGYVVGRAILDDQLCSATAATLGVPVASVEYQLAPKHAFPTLLDDCHAGWDWLQAHAAELGVDPRNVAIGGQSAGGGLAAALVQRLHDGAGARPVAQWLFCPMLDDRTAAKRDLDAVDHFIWNNRSNAFSWRAFLRAEPGAAELPAYAAAARRENLAGLPQAWIGVGDIDLFAEEDRIYAERLKAAGVEVRFVAVPGAPHAFETWGADTSLARDFIADAQRWLGAALCRSQTKGASPWRR